MLARSWRLPRRAVGSVRGRNLSSTPPAVVLAPGNLVEVSGTDTYKFLQGLCTNDVTKLKQRRVMPAAFLTSKGRISATTVMYDTSLDDTGPPTVVLEVESSTGQDFLQYLKLYKLRSKVTIKSIGWRICFTPKESGASSDHPPNVVAKVEDPRLPNFGVRSLVTDVADTPESSDQGLLSWYERYKIVHGVVDGRAVHNRIPLECNLDLLHYISFAKGCYVGQELTARTKFKGLVRKRLVPFLLASKAEQPASGNAGNFEPLSSTLKTSLTATDYAPALPSSGSILGVGSRVYAEKDSNKSIGEVVHLDSSGTIGVAMLQQAMLDGRAGNFVVRAPVTKEGAGEDEQQGEEGNSETGGLSSEIGYISTYRPDWFTGLDEKTGNVLDI